MYVHYSLTVIALILLYGCNCISTQLPSKVMMRLTTLPNNAPQEMTCCNRELIDGLGLGAFKNGQY